MNTVTCKECKSEVYVWFVVANGYCPNCGSAKGVKLCPINCDSQDSN